MKNKKLNKLYFAVLVLGIMFNLISASNAYKDSTESNSNSAEIKDIKQEQLLDLLNKLKSEDSLSVPLAKRMIHKSRKTKTRPKFRIFNINKLFNPAGLWEYKDKI